MRVEELSESGAELWQMAVLTLGILLRAEVIGVVAVDKIGVAIVPKPACDLELMDFFGSVDWKTERRVAEEFRR